RRRAETGARAADHQAPCPAREPRGARSRAARLLPLTRALWTPPGQMPAGVCATLAGASHNPHFPTTSALVLALARWENPLVLRGCPSPQSLARQIPPRVPPEANVGCESVVEAFASAAGDVSGAVFGVPTTASWALS